MKSIILVLFFSSSIFGQKKENGITNFDGIYETKCEFLDDDQEGEKSFLRFYPNQKVISVGTECDATVIDLEAWFNIEMEHISIGDYEIKGRKIKFHTTSRTGTVNYKGFVTKNGILKFKSKSLINGYRSREKYQFIKVVDLK